MIYVHMYIYIHHYVIHIDVNLVVSSTTLINLATIPLAEVQTNPCRPSIATIWLRPRLMLRMVHGRRSGGRWTCKKPLVFVRLHFLSALRTDIGEHV